MITEEQMSSFVGNESQNLLIKILWHLPEFYFYRILYNKNFKMEVEQTNYVSHLIITVQLYY